MHRRRVRLKPISEYRAVVGRTQALLDRAASHVRTISVGDPIDSAQIQLYDLAFSAAEMEAARVALEYGDATAAEPELRADLARFFVADAIGNVLQRLRIRSADYGLQPTDLDTGDLTEASQAAFIERLGTAMVERTGTPLPDLLDEEKSMMRATFRQFADERVAHIAERVHREDAMIPDDVIEGLKSLGCFGLSVPQRFGGLNPDDGDDSLGMVVVTEELSRGSLGAAGSLITRPEIMARALLEGGTEAQKRRWLPALAAGEPLCAISVTEPNTGSDVASVALKATRTDGGWRLNGGKTWCTFAGKAGVILVLARTDANVKPPHRGLSLFLVEKPSTDDHVFEFSQAHGGRVTGRAISTLGYRGMHSFEMFYDDFFVPNDHVVGEEEGLGKGFYFTMRGFAGGRIQTAARATGLMQAAFERAVSYAQERRVFNRRVASFPLTLAKLARMGAYITICRQFSYAVARLMDAGRAQMEASLVKLLACKHAEWVTREALQIHGGMGYAEESAVSRYYVDARVLSIFEGAEETLALRVVGKSLLENR